MASLRGRFKRRNERKVANPFGRATAPRVMVSRSRATTKGEGAHLDDSGAAYPPRGRRRIQPPFEPRLLSSDSRAGAKPETCRRQWFNSVSARLLSRRISCVTFSDTPATATATRKRPFSWYWNRTSTGVPAGRLSGRSRTAHLPIWVHSDGSALSPRRSARRWPSDRS